MTHRAVLRIGLLAVFLTMHSHGYAQELSKKPLGQMTGAELGALVAEAQRTIDDALIGQTFFSEDALPLRVQVHLDTVSGILVIDMDEKYGPDAYYSEMQDFGDELSDRLHPLLDRTEGLSGFRLTYGGYAPEHWPVNRPTKLMPRR